MKTVFSYFLLYFSLLPLLGCGYFKVPTDESLILALSTNRKAYEKVVNEFISKGIHRVEIESDGVINVRPKTIEGTNILEIKELFVNELFISLVSASARKDAPNTINEIVFIHFRQGFVFAGESKGLVYVVDDRDIHTIDQINNINRQNREIYNKRLYRRIDSNWFVYYEYSP